MAPGVGRDAATAAVARVAREESARVMASLLRITDDLGGAEEAFQDALAALFEAATREGLPDRPGAWVMTVARRRAIDQVRRRRRARANEAEVLTHDAPVETDGPEGARLHLVATCCDARVPREAAVALTLRLVSGLSVAEIARAFLVPESTIAQRLARAKRALAARGRRPEDAPLVREEVAVALDAAYLVFNEGWAATSGDRLVREPLCTEALRLAAMIVEEAREHGDAWGLLALIELSLSRAATRVDERGAMVLLADQDRASWDRALIGAGLAHLERAKGLGPPGRYTLEALIAACHACAPSFAETDFATILALYDLLLAAAPSPIVALNRAATLGMIEGPRAALRAIERIVNLRALSSYPPLHATRADLYARLGDAPRARRSWTRARALSKSGPERAYYARRIAECEGA